MFQNPGPGSCSLRSSSTRNAVISVAASQSVSTPDLSACETAIDEMLALPPQVVERAKAALR